jgi:methylated-DNA-[protein]-cysteine S-methyltransferase
MDYCRMQSPFGPLLLASDAAGLRCLHLDVPGHASPFQEDWQERPERLASAGTPFQRRVWDALLRIPYGETRSYLDIAESLGAPSAVRAVGAANGKNPIAIVIPCHRVIGSNGSLTGYGGGIEMKARLLALEGAAAAPRGQLSLLTNLH